MTFKLDTSGFVMMEMVNSKAGHTGSFIWPDISPFTQGYIEALMAPFDIRVYGFSDLAPETLARIIADCDRRRDQDFLDTAECGALFWIGRQNGNLNAFPPLTVQLGDDGKVRFA